MQGFGRVWGFWLSVSQTPREDLDSRSPNLGHYTTSQELGKGWKRVSICRLVVGALVPKPKSNNRMEMAVTCSRSFNTISYTSPNPSRIPKPNPKP